jgi:hypothetical protein
MLKNLHAHADKQGPLLKPRRKLATSVSQEMREGVVSKKCM